MATRSEVKAGLDAIADVIAGSIRSRAQAKVQLLAARNQLENLPTQFADVIVTIDGYAGGNEFESLTKSTKSLMATEYTALKAALEAELTALGVAF